MNYPASQAPSLRPIRVIASSSWNSTPEQAADGDGNTAWNSGTWARPDNSQWIQLDLGHNYNVASIRLQVAQSPAGRTIHQIWAGQTSRQTAGGRFTSEGLWLVGTLDSVTADGDSLVFRASANHVRFVTINTIESPSWVAWREIEFVQGLEYFGYYASAFAWTGSRGNYTQEISDHCNVTWIGRYDLPHTVSLLQEARSLGMGAILYVDPIFFPGDGTLYPDYEARWNTFADGVQLYADNIVAFYPIDEPKILDETPKRNVETVIAAIRTRFPRKPVAVILDYLVTSDARFRDPNYVLPDYDWIGFDCYDGSWGGCQNLSIPDYVNIIRGKLRTHQRLILVPPAWYQQGSSPDRDQQVRLVNLAEKYRVFACADWRCIGIFPFLWQSFNGSGGPNIDNIGAQDMPLVKAKFREVGLAILNPAYSRIYPVGVSASRTWTPPPGHPPMGIPNVIDGDLDTQWNAGDFPPQWILLDLGQQCTIGLIRLNVAQYPPGDTVHTILVGQDLQTLSRLGSLDGLTEPGQWLELREQVEGVRYIRIETSQSPSWVAWNEIEVYGPISFLGNR